MDFHRLVARHHLATYIALALSGIPAWAQGPEVAPQNAASSLGGVAAPTASPIDPMAQAILDTTLQRYRDLKSFQALLETSVGGKTPSRERIQYIPSGSVRITGLDAEGKPAITRLITPNNSIILLKNNNNWEWMSTPARPLKAGENNRSRLGSVRVTGLYTSSLLAGMPLFDGASGIKLKSLTLDNPTTLNGIAVDTVTAQGELVRPAGATISTTFYIGKQDSLLYSTKNELKLPGGDTVSVREMYKDIQSDAVLPASAFDFAPPTGAKKVTEFSMPEIKAKVGQPPLAFSAKDIDGKPLSLQQYKGKVVLLDFWATWCGPCVGELPNVKAVYNKYRAKGFDVVGISLDQDVATLKKFIKAEQMPWRQVFDGGWDGPVGKIFNVKSIPATLLIDRQGRIVAIDPRGPALAPAVAKALSKK